MIALACLIADALVHAAIGFPLLYSILIYALYRLLRDEESWTMMSWYGVLGCILLEDYMLYGRFGMALLILIPLFLMVDLLRHKLFHARNTLFFMFIVIFIAGYDALARFILFNNYALNSVTMSKILINLIIGYVVFWGTQGNRSLLVKGRKVWTPNRKDAS